LVYATDLFFILLYLLLDCSAVQQYINAFTITVSAAASHHLPGRLSVCLRGVYVCDKAVCVCVHHYIVRKPTQHKDGDSQTRRTWRGSTTAQKSQKTPYM